MNTSRFTAPFLFLLLVITLCGVTTFLSSRKAIDLYFNGVKTAGQVVDFAETRSSKGMRTRARVIAYRDISEAEHTIQMTAATGLLAPAPPQIGDTVEVLYLPDSPADGTPNKWSELWLFPTVFGSFTLLFLVALFGTLRSAATEAADEPQGTSKLKTSGVAAVATVIAANAGTRLLHYRIDKDARRPTAALESFESAEQMSHTWKPSRDKTGIRKGDQFRAYIDAKLLSDKGTVRFYVDFNDRIGHNPNVKSIEDDEDDYE